MNTGAAEPRRPREAENGQGRADCTVRDVDGDARPRRIRPAGERYGRRRTPLSRSQFTRSADPPSAGAFADERFPENPADRPVRHGPGRAGVLRRDNRQPGLGISSLRRAAPTSRFRSVVNFPKGVFAPVPLANGTLLAVGSTISPK